MSGREWIQSTGRKLFSVGAELGWALNVSTATIEYVVREISNAKSVCKGHKVLACKCNIICEGKLFNRFSLSVGFVCTLILHVTNFKTKVSCKCSGKFVPASIRVSVVSFTVSILSPSRFTSAAEIDVSHSTLVPPGSLGPSEL
jgi:hypothetical protein